jgi:hypothetical protein
MRVLILAALLLGSSSLCPSFAQEQAKPAIEAPQTTVPGRAGQNADQPRDQRSSRDPSRADDRARGQDWRPRRGDDDRFGRDRSDMGSEGRMRRDGEPTGRDEREMGPDPRMQRDRDGDRGRYTGRGDRDRDYADRDKDDRSYFDEDRPRRRVKICIEYDNGDEYCRYRR